MLQQCSTTQLRSTGFPRVAGAPGRHGFLRRLGKAASPAFVDAYRFERRARDAAPDWDLASIAAPDAAVLFANDTAYTADPVENVFKFGPPRAVEFTFVLPHWPREPKDVFRVDVDGIHEAKWRSTAQGVIIQDTQSRDAIYIATRSLTVRTALEQRRQSALAVEAAHLIEREALGLLKK